MNLSDNVKRDSAQVCRFVNDVLHNYRDGLSLAIHLTEFSNQNKNT